MSDEAKKQTSFSLRHRAIIMAVVGCAAIALVVILVVNRSSSEKDEDDNPPAEQEQEEVKEEEEEVKEEEEVVLESQLYQFGSHHQLQGGHSYFRIAQISNCDIGSNTTNYVFQSISIVFARTFRRGTPKFEYLLYEIIEPDGSPVGVPFEDCDDDVWSDSDDCKLRILYDFTSQPDFDKRNPKVALTIDRSAPTGDAFLNKLKANRSLRLFLRVSGETYEIEVHDIRVQLYYIV